MRRAPFLAKLLCVGFLASACGCSFFGIDTREGIEYVTTKKHKTVKEPMYARSVPGTNLVKRWPTRYGINYGYAPWQRPDNPSSVVDSPKENPAQTKRTLTKTASGSVGSPTVGSSTVDSSTVGSPAVVSAEDSQYRDKNVRQASAELPIDNRFLSPVHAATSAGDRATSVRDRATSDFGSSDMRTASDAKVISVQSNVMGFEELLPNDRSMSPGYHARTLPSLDDERPSTGVGQRYKRPAPAASIAPPGGDLPLRNPLRL